MRIYVSVYGGKFLFFNVENMYNVLLIMKKKVKVFTRKKWYSTMK